MNLMPIARLDDWEMRIKRQDAFWDGAIIDRPVANIVIPKKEPVRPWPKAKNWATIRDRWMDAEYVADQALAGTSNCDYYGDSLPTACPNLGPEVLSAFYGSPLEFSEGTSWSIPILEDWADVDRLQFSMDNEYWDKIVEITDAMLAKGRDTFYTGITDLHPGADAIAAFRDPLNLNIDMIENPDQVRKLVERVTQDYARIYNFYADKLVAADQAITCWAGVVSSRRWYVPSNDFSCMISKAMFDETFLPGIAAECRLTEANIYHLDGPQALQHLDSLLGIPELNAIQWVYGAGNGIASDWLHVYKRCQQAGKGIQLYVGVDELETIMANLRPEGVWLSVGGVPDGEAAQRILDRLAKW